MTNTHTPIHLGSKMNVQEAIRNTTLVLYLISFIAFISLISSVWVILGGPSIVRKKGKSSQVVQSKDS